MNKKTLLERIGELVRDKQVEGITEVRDESDRSGMRVVIELRRDATPDVVLNQLYRFTQLQITFGINMLALDDGQPRQLGLKDALLCFIRFREEVIQRRARFELSKARDRAHQLVGLAIAVADIDEVIRLIRASPDAPAARVALMARDWPAADIGPLLALIDEPGNVITPDKHRAPDRGAGARHTGNPAATPDRAGTRKDPRRPDQDRRGDPATCWTSWPRIRAAWK